MNDTTSSINHFIVQQDQERTTTDTSSTIITAVDDVDDTATTIAATTNAKRSDASIPPPLQQQDHWPADPNMYQLIGKIGQGAFATVWKAYRIITPTMTTTSGTSTANDDSNDKGTNVQHQLPVPISSSTTTCAVKVLNLDHADASNLVEIRNEVAAMRLLSHTNVLTCYTAFVNERNLWLVTPLMEKGSALYSLQSIRKIMRSRHRNANTSTIKHDQQQQQYERIRLNDTTATAPVTTDVFTTSQSSSLPLTATASNDSCKNTNDKSVLSLGIPSHNDQQQQPLNTPKIHMEQHIMYILHETIVGLQYIHDNLQIHRDIKGGNILIDSNGGIKIADFGVSSFLLLQNGSLYQHEKARTFVGTPCWMAPEVMEQVNGYDYKADIWSLGITALELAKGYAPYAKYPPMKVLILTIQEDPPSLASYDVETGFASSEDDYGTDCNNNPIIDTYTSEFEDLVRLCLQKDPIQRPTCTELLASIHFKEYSNIRPSRVAAMRDEICAIIKDVGYRQEEHQQQRAASLLVQQQQPIAEKTLGGNGGILNNNDAKTVMAGNKLKSEIIQQRVSSIEDRPAGTTWVFSLDDTSDTNHPSGTENDVRVGGSASLTTLADGQQEQDVSNESTVRRRGSGIQLQPYDSHGCDDEYYDDVLADLDEFERQTGGENYDRQQRQQQDSEQLPQEKQVEEEVHVDDIQQVYVASSSFDNMRLNENDGPTTSAASKNTVVEVDDLNQFMDEFEQNTSGEDFRRSS